MKKVKLLSDNGTPKSLMFLLAQITHLKLRNLAQIHVVAVCAM